MKFEQLAPGGFFRRRRMFGKVLLDGERRHSGDLLFMHQPHGFVAELIGVIYGSHASSNGVEPARLARGVDGNALAHARGFSHSGAEFGFRVLIGRGELAIAERILAGFVDLYEIGSFLDLLANHSHEFGGVIGEGGVGENALFGVIADGVFVPA